MSPSSPQRIHLSFFAGVPSIFPRIRFTAPAHPSLRRLPNEKESHEKPKGLLLATSTSIASCGGGERSQPRGDENRDAALSSFLTHQVIPTLNFVSTIFVAQACSYGIWCWTKGFGSCLFFSHWSVNSVELLSNINIARETYGKNISRRGRVLPLFVKSPFDWALMTRKRTSLIPNNSFDLLQLVRREQLSYRTRETYRLVILYLQSLLAIYIYFTSL